MFCRCTAEEAWQQEREALFALIPVYLSTKGRQALIARGETGNTEAVMAIQTLCSQQRHEPGTQTELEFIAHEAMKLLHTEERGQRSAASIRTGKPQIE